VRPTWSSAGHSLAVPFDLYDLPVIQTAGEIALAVYTDPRAALIGLIIMVIAFMDIEFELHSNLERHLCSRKIPDIDPLYSGIDHIHGSDTMDVSGVQIHRLPVVSDIVLCCFIKAVITFVFYIFFE
jgi:hypothetical protein